MSNHPPYSYEEINLQNSYEQPSAVKLCDNALTQYFKKYYYQKIISRFNFNLPEEWSEAAFNRFLFRCGFVTVFKSKEFGVICQPCTLYGYNLYYEPNQVIVANPYIPVNLRLTIGKNCELIKLQPDYGSINDIIHFYATMSAVAAQALGVNFQNSKLAFMFFTKNKAAAESYKKLYDEIQQGNPAAFYDKKLLDDRGNQSYDFFNANLSSNFIANDLISAWNKIEQQFNTMVGIPNANTDKAERLITDEVNANNEETNTLVELWQKSISDGMKKANARYGLNLSVSLKNEQSGGIAENGEFFNNRGL